MQNMRCVIHMTLYEILRYLTGFHDTLRYCIRLIKIYKKHDAAQRVCMYVRVSYLHSSQNIEL